MNESNWNHTKTNIRRVLNRNTNPVITGKDDNATTAVNATELPPGFIWVRRQQANGTYGPPFIVQGSTGPGTNKPGIPVNVGVDARSRNTIRDVSFIQAQSLGLNPTQFSAVDPNTNNSLFVNQAFITTAYANIITGTLKVGIRKWLPIVSNTVHSVGGDSSWIADFTGNVPSAGNHCLALISVLPDFSALEVTYSTAKADIIPLDLSDVQEAITAGTSNAMRLWAFSLADAQTSLTEANRFLDLRDPWNHPDGGTESDFYQTVQGNGTPATQRPIIDFIDGTNTTVTVTDDGAGTRTKVKIDASGSGSVTSVAAGTGLSASPSPIVGAGTISLATPVALANGGTHADLSATGPGWLRQASLGADVTVATISRGDIPNMAITVKAKSPSATNVNIASPGATLDGFTLSAGDPILLTAQSTLSQNGPWTWNGAASALTRPSYYASGSTTQAVYGIHILVINGTQYAGTLWYLTSTGAITVDTTSTGFAQIFFPVGVLSGVLGVLQGGTGVSGYTGHAAFVANAGGSAIAYLAPGSAGNVMRSDGTDWTSNAIQAGDISVAAVPNLPGTIITSSTVAAARLGTMTGDSGSGGASGAVPAPATGDAIHGFFGDGTFAGTGRKLVDLTVLGADAANIDLTSIPTTYKTLILRLFLRSDRAATSDNVYLRFNNDSTAANYYSNGVAFGGATASSVERLGTTGTGVEIDLGAVGNTGASNDFSTLTVVIFNYASTSSNRAVFWNGYMRRATTTGNVNPIFGGASWVNAANAISRVTILPVLGSNFKAGSAYMLYGES